MCECDNKNVISAFENVANFACQRGDERSAIRILYSRCCF